MGAPAGSPRGEVRAVHLLSAYGAVTASGALSAAASFLLVSVVAVAVNATGLTSTRPCPWLAQAIWPIGIVAGIVYLAAVAWLPRPRVSRAVSFAVLCVPVLAWILVLSANGSSAWDIGCAVSASGLIGLVLPLALLGVMRAAAGSPNASIASIHPFVAFVLLGVAGIILIGDGHVLQEAASRASVIQLVGWIGSGAALSVLAWSVGAPRSFDRPKWFRPTGLFLIASLMLLGVAIGLTALAAGV